MRENEVKEKKKNQYFSVQSKQDCQRCSGRTKALANPKEALQLDLKSLLGIVLGDPLIFTDLSLGYKSQTVLVTISKQGCECL